MFAKRLLQKATYNHHHHQYDVQGGTIKPTDLDPKIQAHYGIPNTASVLAVDAIQRLLAIGTLDGRIKVNGGDKIEGLLVSPKQSPYKYLEFLQNQGYLVGILIDNDIQVWNLKSRGITCSLQWESNITTFCVIPGSLFMLVGDEYGMVSVLKYAAEDAKLVHMTYQISPDCIVEKAGISLPNDQPVVGVLPQPFSAGHRLLIVYQHGLMVLWDVPESKVLVIKGDRDLHIKGHMSDSPSTSDADQSHNAFEHMNDKEISAICWASSFGSTLAVGYIDGDILLWKLPIVASSTSKGTNISRDDVVKLQLSSAEKRLPVIVLHWSESSTSQNSCDSQLFVYGGSDIGSEEVITVVSLQWSAGMETLRGVQRVDLALIGSFADMVLLSSLGASGKSHFDGLFVLTSPGKLKFYAAESLSALSSQQESSSSVDSPVVVPTLDPKMTATILTLQPCDGKMSKWLSEMASVVSTRSSAEGRKWPLTGGIKNEKSFAEEQHQKRVYIAGYQDGSVRIWDATSPILSLVSVLEGQVHGIENTTSNVSVTMLDLCASLMSLAVGTECGVVRVYNLNNDMEVPKLHVIKHSEHEVYDVPPPQRQGPQCRAAFSLVNSPVRSLQFSASGSKLAVGFENSHVAVFDTILLSVVFISDLAASSKNPVISATIKTFSDAHDFRRGSKHSGEKNPEQPSEELMFTLTKDAKVNIVDSKTGSPFSSRPLHLKKEHTAISMYVLEGNNSVAASSSEHHEQSNRGTEIPNETKEDESQNKGDSRGTEHLSIYGARIADSQMLLCCENALRLYHMKSLIQGEDKPFCKVKLSNTCCWASILKRDDKVCGVILYYQSGALEVRSFPDLTLVMESSLLSVLRWSYRPNMEKMMSSSNTGQICLASGNELAFICVSADENVTRFLESLPLLHDEVVAAAADAAISHSVKQKKQVAATGILGGIVKGFKKEMSNNAKDILSDRDFSQMEEMFSRPVVPNSCTTTVEAGKEEELDIDDIEIDEPLLMPSTSSSHPAKGKTTESHRERLFEGGAVDTKPRTRTPEEIMAAYRGADYAASAAENARNKLLERQEKLERINQRTEELRSGAEDFASLANELVKTMEGRKWWKI